MKDTKLYVFLEKLGPKEWDGFGKYLADPDLGASMLYRQFLEAFRALQGGLIPDSRDAFLAKAAEIAQRDDRPKKGKKATTSGWDGRHMNRHLSQMLDKLFDYLGHQHFLKDEELKRAARTAALAKRGWTHAAQEELAKAEEVLGDAQWNEGHRHLHLAMLAQMPSLVTAEPASPKGHDPLQRAIQLLDKAYCVVALELGTRARNAEVVKGGLHYEDPKWLRLAPEFADALAKEDPRLAAQLELYRMYQPGLAAEQHFEHALQYFEGAQHRPGKGNPVATIHILEHLISYAGQQLQVDRKQFGPAILQLYGYLLTQQAFLGRGELSPVHYHNIAYRALLMGADEGVVDFLQMHRGNLPAELQEPTFKLCLAQLRFFQHRYAEGLELAVEVRDVFGKKDQFELALSARSFHLVLQVSQGEYEEGERTALNYLVWLKRHKSRLAKSRLQGYSMFGQSVAKIAKWHDTKAGAGPQPNWKVKRAQMQQAWERQKPVHKEWMLSMLARLNE